MDARHLATLEPLRFGEFLRDRNLIDDEQWLAALADLWSAPRGRRIGDAIVEGGYLPAEVVEAEARAFHHGLAVIEIGEAADAEIGEIADAEPADADTAPIQRLARAELD